MENKMKETRDKDCGKKWYNLKGTDLLIKNDMDIAINFLKKIKYAVFQNDIDYFACTVTYPLEINGLKINNKEELHKLNFSLKEICKIKSDEKLIYNCLGFIYGNIRFYVKEGKIVDLKLFLN